MTEPPEGRPLPAEETPARRRLSARQILSFAIGIGAVVYFILLIIENSRHVQVDYVFGSSDARLVWLIIVSGFLGWLLGIATSFLIRRRLRRER
jgi:uncharacterized integral membrane protein